MDKHTPSFPGPNTISHYELANGIVVLVHENPHVHSVVMTGSIDAGSLFDPAEAVGLASFVASSVMRGTRRHDFSAIHEMLEGSGASLAVSGGLHTVGFGGKSLAEDLSLLLDLLAEALRYPTLPANQVERLRGEIITGLKIREQDTRFMAGKTFRELAYAPDHPYSRQTRGSVETIGQISLEQLRNYHQQHFGPKGMLLVVVGAVQAQHVLRLVEDRFGDWENPNQPAPPELPALAPFEEARRQTVVMPGKSQSDIVLGFAGPSRFADDWQAANLANSILGMFGMYGRIGAEVREKHGLAYYSYSRVDGGLGPGPWRVIAGVNPANVDQAIEAIRAELRRITTELVSQDELADNKANFVGRLPLQLETNEGIAGILLLMERYQLGLDYLHRYAELVEAVSAEEILSAAQCYLDPDCYALAVAGPEPSPGE
ncbi:MAG: insulinase family protein [Anaerolineae bacterium]|nr:insulinase family protein [Anaerolineae bacterium]